MIKRGIALFKGKYITIETIYKDINGLQINIPEKLQEVRDASKRGELFCPCGCGGNYILVASDKGLREQHFRMKTGTRKSECTIPMEGETFINSKYVLQCWLEDKLNASGIKLHVPIGTIESIKRKLEITLLSEKEKIGLRYWRTRANIVNDELEVLTDNLSGIKVIYIVDDSNRGTNGQYPEYLMMLQRKQSFCLLLKIGSIDYNEATLSAVFYKEDLEGFWCENEIASSKLAEVDIIDGHLYFKGSSVEELLLNAEKCFDEEQEIKKDRQAEKERQCAERQKQMIKLQQEKGSQRARKQQEEVEKRFDEEQWLSEIKKRMIEEEKRNNQEIKRKKEETVQRNRKRQEELEKRGRNTERNGWIKCGFCGKYAKESEFIYYNGRSEFIDIKACKKCLESSILQKIVKKPWKCPYCRGRICVRQGIYGMYYQCTNYPNCDFSSPIKI